MSQTDQTTFLSKPLFGVASYTSKFYGSRSAVLATRPTPVCPPEKHTGVTSAPSSVEGSEGKLAAYPRKPLSQRAGIKWSERGQAVSQVDAMTTPLPFCLHLADS